MKPLELALVPTPGAKPEFLAAVIPLPKNEDGSVPKAMIPTLWQSITEHNPAVVLEGYTRHAWADGPTGVGPTEWQSLHVRSVDGKNKLTGFVKFLQERQKAAFGRFLGTIKGGTDVVTTFVWVVAPQHQKQANNDGAMSTLSCRIAPLMHIPECPLKPKSGDIKIQQQQKQQQSPAVAISIPKAVAPVVPTKRKGFGLLGNLVGAQKRTNQHVVTSATVNKKLLSEGTTTKMLASSDMSMMAPPEASGTAAQQNPTWHCATNGTTFTETQQQPSPTEQKKTATQVLADFRNEMEQSMLDFDIAPEVSTQVSIKLSDYTKQVMESDQNRVTMEVLKYIVYEQAEEVNEEWIAHQEPSEFMDEVTISIYKDGEYAPPEVLEELNRVELPEEMRAQQKLVAEQRRQQELRALKEQEQQQREALKSMAGKEGDQEDNLAALNTQKRDRRTIEEIQRDNAKRPKY